MKKKEEEKRVEETFDKLIKIPTLTLGKFSKANVCTRVGAN